jgi:glycosyltransferase involved in cell wall biosynthesis
MRILLLSGRSDFGGGPAHVYRLLRAIDTSRFLFYIACPDEAPYFDKLGRIPGLSVFPLPLRQLKVANLWRLAQIVRAHRIQCVHSQGKAAGVWARALKWFFPRLKVLHQYHGIHYRQYPAWLQAAYLNVERALSLWTTRVIHVSESEMHQARQLRLCPAAKQIVIRNGVETRAERPLSRQQARQKLELPFDEPVCMVVARYSFAKNLTRSLEIVARLRRSDTPVRYVVVGGADDLKRHELQSHVRSLGVADAVSLLGAREDVAECLCAADVYLSTSRWEGLPLSVLEAMSLGLPVVASKVAGNDAAVTPQTGFLIDEHDVDGFVRAVRRLVLDPDLCARLGAAARQRVAAEFSIERMVTAHERLYSELAGEASQVSTRA